MHIEIGKHYVNKTWKYLVPCLKSYGPTFVAKYNCLYKLAAGIDDTVLDGRFDDKRVIFLLIDKKYKRNISGNVIEWFRNQPFVLTDYAVGDLESTRKHMIVIEIPSMFNDSYDEFLKGRYSAMYNDTDIEYLFKNSPQDVKDIFNRTDEGYNNFIIKIKNSFGTDVTKSDLIGAELDFPIEKFKEVFNYTE